MTHEAQRTAIAEACGWTFRKIANGSPDFWHDPSGKPRNGCELPDCLNDLNAMHEAEKVLRNKSGDHQLFRFISCLENVVVDQATDYGWGFALCHATAAQRAEAFLRTLGLWK